MNSLPNQMIFVHKNCVCLPVKMILALMLLEEATKVELIIDMDEDHMPDGAWMIIALATLNKDHEIFGKSYLTKGIQRGLGVCELEIYN